MQDIVLSSEEDAENVLDVLRKLLDRYEQATVADYLELVGISSSFTDTKVGWTDLTNVSIKSVKDGFFLELPNPESIDHSRPSAFPFLKGWWVAVDVIDDQIYEGWLIDAIGGTMIIENEPSKIRLGIKMSTVRKIDAYRERPHPIA